MFPLEGYECIVWRSSNLRFALTDEMQPIVFEKKRFDSLEKSRTFALVGHFGPLCFRCEKRFPKYFYTMMLHICKIADQDLDVRNSSVFLKKLNLIIKTIFSKMQFLDFLSLPILFF